MSKYDFSNTIVAKVKASAANYAQISSRSQHSSLSIAERVKFITSYDLSQPCKNQKIELNAVIKIVSSKISSEQIKARNKSVQYNPYYHIELRKLHYDLIKKRNEL